MEVNGTIEVDVIDTDVPSDNSVVVEDDATGHNQVLQEFGGEEEEGTLLDMTDDTLEDDQVCEIQAPAEACDMICIEPGDNATRS